MSGFLGTMISCGVCVESAHAAQRWVEGLFVPTVKGKKEWQRLAQWNLLVLLMVQKSGSPVDSLIGSLSYYLRRVLYIPGGAGFLPWQVAHYYIDKSCSIMILNAKMNEIHEREFGVL